MTLAADTPEKLVRYPAEAQDRYVREGLWESPTIAEHLHTIAQEHGERDALVCGGIRLTFAELDRITDQRAAGLHRLGLEPGGAVLLQVHNTVNTVIAWYALLKAGLVPVCTLPLHRGHEIGEIARQTHPVAHLVAARDPRFDLVGFAFAQAEAAGVERTVLVSDGQANDPRAIELDGLGDDIDSAEARGIVEGIQAGLGMQSLAVFQLSGGTTGVPKVIPCLQAPYWHYGASLARVMGWKAGDRIAFMMPIVHNAGVIIGLQGPHSVGATLVLGVPDASAALDLVVRNGATDVLLGPFAFDLVLDPGLAAATTLRRVLFSGKKVPSRYMAALDARTLRCPVQVGDQELAEGGRVLLDLAAANRDPREFADPEEFDPHRTRNRHVSFGAGPHICQGQHLARAELRITLTRLLDRLPDLCLDGEPSESGLVGGSLMTHFVLPVAFTPENVYSACQ